VEELDFESWYLREHPRVVSAVAAITGRASVAGEAADEAFTRACERWDRVRAMASPGGWAHSTALNVARRRLRRTEHERRLLRRVAPAHEPEAPPPTWSIEVWDALRSLPPREREAVVLRHVGDLPVAEVAQVMGVAAGTVASTLASARARLARLLADTAPEPAAGQDGDVRDLANDYRCPQPTVGGAANVTRPAAEEASDA
jgi:RNA polymerase sigma factor (sigma-70 family)